MNQPTQIRDRVARGIAFLDDHVPDWRDRVDPERLNLDSPELDVLGQVFHDDAATEDVFRTSKEVAEAFNYGWSAHELRMMGFRSGCVMGSDLPELHNAWREAVGGAGC